MKLPEDPELQDWLKSQNVDLPPGLDKKDQVFFAMIILLAGRIDRDFRKLKTMLFLIFLLCLAIVTIIS